MYRLPFSRMVLVAAVCGIASLATPAWSSDATAQLAQANKMMQNGAYVKAIEIINATLSSGQIPSDLAGRALLMRAQSQEKLGKSAFALADYNQALWMQGLSPNDKKVAEDGRARVQGGLGIKDDDGDGDGEQPASGSSKTGAVTHAAPARQQQQDSGGISGFFSSLFGGSPEKEERPQRAVVAEVRPEQPTPPKPAKPAVVRAAVATPPAKLVKEARNVEQAAPARTVPAGGASTGEFAIQFAALYEEDKAIAEVNRIEKKFGTDLAGRTPSVVIVPTKDGGTLYKIVAGPYPKGEGVATCELLKSKKLNCMVITHRQQ